MTKPYPKGHGWHGNPEGHAEAGREGGNATYQKYGPEFYRKIGTKGGKQSPGVKSKGKIR